MYKRQVHHHCDAGLAGGLRDLLTVGVPAQVLGLGVLAAQGSLEGVGACLLYTSMAGRWRTLRSTLTVTFSDIVQNLPAVPRMRVIHKGGFFVGSYQIYHAGISRLVDIGR